MPKYSINYLSVLKSFVYKNFLSDANQFFIYI